MFTRSYFRKIGLLIQIIRRHAPSHTFVNMLCSHSDLPIVRMIRNARKRISDHLKRISRQDEENHTTAAAYPRYFQVSDSTNRFCTSSMEYLLRDPSRWLASHGHTRCLAHRFVGTYIFNRIDSFDRTIDSIILSYG